MAARVWDWWFADVPVAPLIMARVGIGLTMVGANLSLLPHLERLVGSRGLIAHLRPELVSWTHAFPHAAEIACGAAVVASFAFAAGVFPRFAAAIIIGVHLALRPLTIQFMWGWTAVIVAFVVYLACSEACAQPRVFRRRKPSESLPRATTSAWTLRLIQIHICAVYLSASWGRMNSPDWLSGRKLLMALISADFGRIPDLFWLDLAPLIAVALYVAWFLEVLAPVMLWVRGVGRYWAIGLALMHLVLELTITLGWWQPMMLSLLVVFLPAGWCERVLVESKKLRRR